MAHGQIVKWGNSLAVRIPKPVAEEAGVGNGDAVTIEATDGHIAVRKKNQPPSLKELVARITPENRYGEVVTGQARGKELIEW